MSFERPAWLVVALAFAAVLVWLYAFAESRKTANDLAYSDLDFFAREVRPRTWIPAALRASAAAALIFAALGIAGPRMTVPLPARDGEAIVCIDTSGSMQSTDVAPTRAEAAKNAARAFIDATPAGTKVGVIAFSSTASVVAGLQTDHDAVRAALDEIPAPNGATAIGDALQLSAKMFSPSGHRVVILITDGVNNTGTDPQEMSAFLGARHVPIYTIGIGTNNGDLIPGTGGQATIDEDALRSYAQAGGGAYSRAADASQLRDALARLGRVTSLEPKKISAEVPFLVAGFTLLCATLLSGLALGRYP